METETDIVGVTTFLASISKAYQEPDTKLIDKTPEPFTNVEDPEAQVLVPEKAVF